MMWNITKRDVQTWVDNTGPGMWDEDQWGEGVSAEGWVDWLWENFPHIPEGEGEFQVALAGYLLSNGKNPADYGLPVGK